MNRRLASVFCGAAMVAGAFGASTACSSSSGGSGNGAGFQSSLPSDSSAGALSDSDFASFCASAEQYIFSELTDKTVDCNFVGVAAAAQAALIQGATDDSVKQACTSGYNACLQTPRTDAGTTGASSTGCTKPTGNCTATVGQIDACVNDLANAIKAASCANVTLASFNTSTGSTTSSSSNCGTASQACPGFITQLMTP